MKLNNLKRRMIILPTNDRHITLKLDTKDYIVTMRNLITNTTEIKINESFIDSNVKAQLISFKYLSKCLKLNSYNPVDEALNQIGKNEVIFIIDLKDHCLKNAGFFYETQLTFIFCFTLKMQSTSTHS